MWWQVEGVGDEVLVLFSSVILCGIIVLICIRKANVVSTASPQPPVQALDPSDETVISRIRRERSTSSGSNGSSTEPNRDCPICLQAIELLVMTNCAHYYCAKCLMQCWQYRFEIQALDCPCCRQAVTFLHESFSRDLASLNDSIQAEAGDLALQIASYNRRFSGQPRSVRWQIDPRSWNE